MTPTELRSLAAGLELAMRESGKRERPTIQVTDDGVGQHPSDFASTLLSLNEDNKVNLPYTMGTFGQGGSATLSFSKFVLYCSRRHPELLKGCQEDRVGFTIAFLEETDPNTSKWPRYVWLVKDDNTAIDLPPEAFPELKHGTRLTHIEYDAQGLKAAFTTQMWQFLNNSLFSPVLPFILSGDRTKDEREAGSRVILGNSARLSRTDRARGDIKIVAEDTHRIELGPYGSVDASWWVLGRSAESTPKSDPAKSYVDPQTAVVVTLHGQRQAAHPRIWLKDTTKLPFLYRNMIVNINTNGLNGSGRREFYASTRERERRSDLSKAVFDQVAELIRGDSDLKHLNYLERERQLVESSRAANEKVKKRLGKFVKTKLKNQYRPGSQGQGTRWIRWGGRRRHRPWREARQEPW